MVDTIKFSQMPSAGNINNNDIMPSLRSGANVLLNNPWTFLPPGSTADRPAPSSTINYRLRFNTDEQLYEYYDAILGAWTQLQESAFTQGPFVIYKADASIPDGQNLGALSNGILRQTITTGVATLDIAVNGTDYYGPGFVIPGTDGGTGVNNGARTINLGSPTTGYVLTSDSSGNATWQSITSGGAITTIDGDSGSVTPTAGVITINGGSTGLTTTGSVSTLSLGGLLNATFGGLGVSNPTAHGILVGEGSSPVTPIVLSTGQILIGSTGADPVAAAINSGTGILVGNGPGSITVSLAAIADHTLLANISGGSAAPTSTTLTALIDNAIGSTQGNILYRNASAWVVLAPGTSGQFLTSGGAAANVSWSSQVAPTGQALTKTDDSNVTLTLGGSPTVALLAATSLTLGWTGQLSVLRGGTGLAAITAHNLLIGNGTSAATLLAPSATSGIPLISQGSSADPAYGTAVVAGGGTGLTSATAYAVLCGGTTSTGAFQSIASVGSSGQVLTSNGAGALPTFQNVTGTGTVNSGSINQLTWYAANGTAVSGLSTGNNGVLVTSAGGVPSISSTLPSTVQSNITATGAVTGTSFNTITGVAAKSDENTATSTTVVTCPANAYNNPAGTKAWGTVANNGSAASLQDSFNTTSVSRTGTGVVQVTLSNAMSNTNYAVLTSLNQGGQVFFNVSVSSSTVFTINSFTNLLAAIDVNFAFMVLGHSIN